MMILRGRVRTGLGDFGKWIGRLQSHYREKTGLSLYPGTLNVELEAPYRVPPNPMRLEAHEYGGSVSVNIVPCRIFDLPAIILRTDRNEAGEGAHPHTLVEIACEHRLRDRFGLKDGDWVEIEVPELTRED